MGPALACLEPPDTSRSRATILLYFAAAFGLVAAGLAAWLAFLIVGVALLLIAGILAGIGYLIVKRDQATGAHHRPGQSDGRRSQGCGAERTCRGERATDRGPGRPANQSHHLSVLEQATSARREPRTWQGPAYATSCSMGRGVIVTSPPTGFGSTLRVGEHFSPRRPLVVLLHGFGEFWWAWRHQIPALDAAGFSVAAMDLRGYGASDKTPRGYDPQTTAFDVTGVIKSLGFSSGVVIGHDWGGMAGWATMAYAAAPVRAFVSVAAPHPLAFPWRTNLPTLAFFQLPLFPERRIMADDGLYIEELLRSWAADGAGISHGSRSSALPRRLDAVAEPALCVGVPADVRPQPVPGHGA